MITTRFAPSPTGFLHLGHAFAALFAARAAEGGTFLLRIEDIDSTRCRPEFTEALFEDLRWLGLSWKEPARVQSEHLGDYAAALETLRARGLVYPCFCTRREIEAEVANAAHAPHADDETVVYPGTCRSLSGEERARKFAEGKVPNWRLDVRATMRETGPLFWFDKAKGKIEAQPEIFGDVVLARKDIGTSYHLSATVDDHLQGVTLVTRGEDLLASTHVHRLLQAALGFETPTYWHHRLITDSAGRRFAKRDSAATLRSMREKGVDVIDVLAQADGLLTG